MTTKQQIYVAKMKAILKETDHLRADSVQRMLKLLNVSRRELKVKLLDAVPGNWQAYHYNQLKAVTEQTIRRLSAKFIGELATQQETIWELGIEIVEIPLETFDIQAFIPELNIKALSISQAGTADLITGPEGIINSLIGKINGQINRAILGEQSPFATIQAIGRKLTDQGPFGSIATRAEMITRTELGRVQSLATHKRLQQVKEAVPKLKKQWQHSGNLNGRKTHMVAHGQIRPVGYNFDVGGEKLMHPLDPTASAKNTVGCGCYETAYMDGWPSLTGLARAA